MAFDYFAQQKVDVAVIEVGLGGRLDSTNVITAEVSLITNISWDHANLLGDTLQKIAAEKAGIIKQRSLLLSVSGNLKLKVSSSRKHRRKRARSLLLQTIIVCSPWVTGNLPFLLTLKRSLISCN